VELTLTNDLTQGLFGLPAGDIRFVISQLSPGTGGGSSEWQSYVTRDSGGIPDAQADAERGSAGTWVDNGDGTYQYTFAQALTAYPAGPVSSITIRASPATTSSTFMADRGRISTTASLATTRPRSTATRPPNPGAAPWT
jgi:hypothetical protein